MRFSGLLCAVALTLPLPLAAQNALDFYADGLHPAFQDWSWAAAADYSLANASPVHAGNRSIRFLPRNWGGLLFADVTNRYAAADYESLTLWIHGGSGSGQNLRLSLLDDTAALAELELGGYVAGGIVAGTWHQATIPFTAATGLTSGSFNRVQIMDNSGGVQAALYIDDLRFNPRTTPPQPGNQTVAVDLASERKAVNPLIFGVSYGESAALRYPLRRWGGNSTTRYNWRGDWIVNSGDRWRNLKVIRNRHQIRESYIKPDKLTFHLITAYMGAPSRQQAQYSGRNYNILQTAGNVAVIPAACALQSWYDAVEQDDIYLHLEPEFIKSVAAGADLNPDKVEILTTLETRSPVIESLARMAFDELQRHFPQNPGTRAIVHVTVTRVSESCGYSVPAFEFRGPREALDRWAATKGPDGLAAYRAAKNQRSIDGLPAFTETR